MRRALSRIGRSVRGIREELAGARRLTADRRSFARWALDVLGYRVLRFVDLGRRTRPRTIRLRGGLQVNYRLDRGDIRALAETFILEAYALPNGARADAVVDLGANIGLVSLFLAYRHGARRVVAVEPVPENAELVRRNLAANGIDGEVLTAAIGPANGTVSFRADPRNSTIGAIGDGGVPTPMVDMATVLARLPESRIDVLKLDVEGGEEALLSGEVGWLDRVDMIVAELHPHAVDVTAVIARIEAAGFRWEPVDRHGPDWLFGDVMGFFVRTERTPSDPASGSSVVVSAP